MGKIGVVILGGCLLALGVYFLVVKWRGSRNDEQAASTETASTATSKFLDSYSGQSTDELISLELQYRVDSIVLAFEQAIDQKAARIGEDRLSSEERIVLAIEALEREVNNGGYHQFFWNSSVEFAPIIVESLRRIDCPKVAALTQRAIDALGISAPFTVAEVENAITSENEGRDAELGKCDEAYYRNEEDIAGKLFDFIKANKANIRLR